MLTFGLIAEGATDHIVLGNILRGWFGDDEIRVRPEQPRVDETGRRSADAHGGWTVLLKYLERGEYKQALQFNKYLVIQIDTDRSEDAGYDVPWRDGARELSPEELVERVTARLVESIGADMFERHRARFIFAVSVHSIECWLLPIVFPDMKAKAGKVTGCRKMIDGELSARGEPCLKKGDGKSAEAYRALSSAYANRKMLRRCAPKNPSLRLFVERLGELPAPADSAEDATEARSAELAGRADEGGAGEGREGDAGPSSGS